MKQEFDVGRDLMLPLIQGLNVDISRTNTSLQESNYWIGFAEGFRFGVEEGERRAQAAMQNAMGLASDTHPLYSEDYKQYAEGPVTSKGAA